MENREVWQLNLELLLPQPSRKAGNEERREEELNKSERILNIISVRLSKSPQPVAYAGF